MPTPTGGAWPPRHLASACDAYRDWDAGYTGDPDQLGAVTPTAAPSSRPDNSAAPAAGLPRLRCTRASWSAASSVPSPTRCRARPRRELARRPPPPTAAQRPGARCSEPIDDTVILDTSHRADPHQSSRGEARSPSPEAARVDGHLERGLSRPRAHRPAGMMDSVATPPVRGPPTKALGAQQQQPRARGLVPGRCYQMFTAAATSSREVQKRPH